MTPVDVWIAAVCERVAQPTELGRLDDIERARLDQLKHVPTARAYLALHSLARQVVGGIIGAPAHAVRFDRTCTECGRQHGRPTVGGHPGLHVSLSRTSGVVALAVTTVGLVGIDVEQVGAANFAGFDQVALHPAEREPAGPTSERDGWANATAWVRKEAALKALGTGLRTDPATMLTPSTGRPTVVVPGTEPIAVTELVLRGPASLTHVGAVAVWGPAAEVVVHAAALSA